MYMFKVLIVLPLSLVAAAPFFTGSHEIPGSFIVSLQDNTDQNILHSTIERVFGFGDNLEIGHRFNFGSFRGFSLSGGSLSHGLLDLVRNLEHVARIEPDMIVRLKERKTQKEAPWNLARLSSREPNTDKYVFDSNAGNGTHVYMLDSGINTQHDEFENRAFMSISFAPDETGPEDRNGHGTHTAGTVGGKKYGVAKKAQLVGIKVVNGDGVGASSSVIAGLQWAVNNMLENNRTGRAVANLSLGGPRVQAVNDAARAAVEAGMFLAVAAGNENNPADLSSPASEPRVCTVGATDIEDNVASFSNYGTKVDVLAPGVNITSAWIDGDDSTKTLQGTSMAAPHIAGLAAYLMGKQGSWRPELLCERIKDLATKDRAHGRLKMALGTPNLIAYNGIES